MSSCHVLSCLVLNTAQQDKTTKTQDKTRKCLDFGFVWCCVVLFFCVILCVVLSYRGLSCPVLPCQFDFVFVLCVLYVLRALCVLLYCVCLLFLSSCFVCFFLCVLFVFFALFVLFVVSVSPYSISTRKSCGCSQGCLV
jgi:hypothetical protein